MQRVLPEGWALKVHSVDIHPKYNPTTAVDILRWDYRSALSDFLSPSRQGDMIWVHASPPCTEFSKAKSVGVRDLPLADSLVKRALRVIKFCGSASGPSQPFFWSLENPVGLLRTRPYMQRLQQYLNTTSYCKWGRPYRKDTDIWTNVPNASLPLCRLGNYCKQKQEMGTHGVTAQRGHAMRGEEIASVGSGARENVYPLPSRLTGHLFRSALASLGGSRKDA